MAGSRVSAVVSGPADGARTTRLWLAGILVLALALRLIVLIALPNTHHPDEIFQTLEQAHRLVFGYGVVPWEFRLGIRSWILPGLLAVPLALGSLGDPDPATSVLVVQIAVTVLSLVTVACAFLLGRRLSLTHAIVAGFATAVWFELIFHAGRTLSETIATVPLVLALLLAGQEAPRRSHLMATGLLLGSVVVLRPHLAPAVAVVGIWIVWRNGLRSVSPLALGGILPLALTALVDTWTWGMPLASIVRNIDVNVIQGTADAFGVSPVDGYMVILGQAWRIATPVVVALALLGARRFPVWLLTAAVILGTHSLIGHKEARFIFPAVTCLVILAGIGSGDIVGWVRVGMAKVAPARLVPIGRAVLPVVLVGWAAASLALSQVRVPWSEWYRQRASLAAYHLLYDEPDLCGVGGIGLPMWQSSGYVHLHREVPIYLLDGPEHPEAYSHALLRPADQAVPTGGFEQIACFADTAGELCIYRRPGGCRPVPGLAPVTTI